jgi:hypothetical protein
MQIICIDQTLSFNNHVLKSLGEFNFKNYRDNKNNYIFNVK